MPHLQEEEVYGMGTASDGKVAFVAAKRKLMSQNLHLAASGEVMSLAELGLNLLCPPSKKRANDSEGGGGENRTTGSENAGKE